MSGIIAGVNGYARPASGSRRLTSDQVATSNMTVVSQTAYAKYVGSWTVPLTTLDLEYFIHGVAAVGGGWAEVAVATGTYTSKAASIDLTVLSYADVSADVIVASTRVEKKTMSGMVIPANADIWLIYASSHATTQASMRTDIADFHGKARTRANFRPSTSIGVAAAFANSFAGLTVPLLEATITT